MKMRKLIGYAFIIGLIMTAAVCAGCITSSEPDPIVGTFVFKDYINQQSTSINTSINTEDEEDAYMAREQPVGTISNSNLILKFYENGTLLECSIADKRVIHSYYKWSSIGNLTYLVTENRGTEEFTLDDTHNELKLTKVDGNIRHGPSLYRNDSYVIPPHYDTHIPNYDKIYNNSDGGKL